MAISGWLSCVYFLSVWFMYCLLKSTLSMDFSVVEWCEKYERPKCMLHENINVGCMSCRPQIEIQKELYRMVLFEWCYNA